MLEGQATTLLTEILLGQRQYEVAREHATRALDLHRQTGYRLGEARTLAVIGHLQSATDRPQAAQAAWQAAYDLFMELGVPVPEYLAGRHKAA